MPEHFQGIGKGDDFVEEHLNYLKQIELKDMPPIITNVQYYIWYET